MKRFMVEGETDSANLAHVLMLLSRGSGGGGGGFSGGDAGQGDQHRVFECKTCSRKFSSFQALGGHRASHKKPRLSGEAQAAQQHQNALARPKLHECSICGLEFSIRQALGGHMRRHRSVAAELIPHHAPAEKPVDDPAGEKRGALCLDFDLNLSPSEEETNFCTLRLGLTIVDCPH